MQFDKVVYVDFETWNETGLGLSYWHPDFRVTSASFLSDGNVMFTEDFKEMEETLAYFIQEEYCIVTYNIAFDVAIMKHVFKQPKAFELALDAWRIFCYINLEAGDKRSKVQRKTSLSAAMDYLFGVADYKKPYIDKIKEMGLAKTDKEAHANIGQLPKELLEEYNNLDTINCFHVTTECLKRLEQWGVEWEEDYLCFRREVELYADAFYKGIRVNRELALKNIEKLVSDVATARHEIANLEAVKALESMINKPAVLTKPATAAWKKSKGLDKKYLLSEDDAREAEEWNRRRKWIAFNPASNKHKQKLFLDILHMPVVKLTAGTVPQPQMNKAVMKAYGPVGKLFITLQNLTKQLEELEKIELLSRVDGRCHFPLKSGGTKSGRSSSKA